MITYPLPQFEQQKAEILQRYKILGGAEEINTSPAAQTVALALGAPIVIVALTERYRHWFRVSHGCTEHQHDQLQDFCATAILSDTAFWVENAADEPYFARDLDAHRLRNVAFYAGAPLHNPDGQRFGTLCVISPTPRAVDPAAMNLLRSFATLVSGEICLRSAGRYAVRDLLTLEEDKCGLYNLAMTDPLTGALNRRAMHHFADREVTRAVRHGLNLSAVMLDIDHFKKVNDVHGHAAGDDVLKAVARNFRQSIRDEDILARVGGEEFALILPETTPDDAVRLCNRLRQNIKSMTFSGDGGPFSVTISMGISEPLPGDREITPILEKADKALYDAKRSGRDRVIVGELSSDEALIA